MLFWVKSVTIDHYSIPIVSNVKRFLESRYLRGVGNKSRHCMDKQFFLQRLCCYRIFTLCGIRDQHKADGYNSLGTPE